MQAVKLIDGCARWGSRAIPAGTDAGTLLVRVRAAAINGTDRRALIESTDTQNDHVGIECAGEVVAVGTGVTEFAVGDRVMGLTSPGAQAEFVEMPVLTALSVPAELGWSAAGAYCEVWTTAHDALSRQLQVGHGDRLLVTGAAGGVGLAAVQLAKQAGADVVASVRRESSRSKVQQILGCTTEVVEPEIAPATGPFSHVLELVGGSSVMAGLEGLAHGGRIAVIGVSAGSNVPIKMLTIMRGSLTLTGSTLKDRPLEDKGAALQAAAHASLDGYCSGRLQMPVKAFQFEQAEEAYSTFSRGGSVGKTVLVR